MRSDMKKVLCERPRTRSAEGYRAVRRAENRGDPEQLPHQRGMRRPYVLHDEDRKELTDHITPLQRFCAGSVGRRYDDVWSELCAVVAGGDTVSQHLKDHARSEIETQVQMIDGVAYHKAGYRYWRSAHPVSGLYVDPDDGVVRRTPPSPRPPRPVSVDGRSYWRDANDVLTPTRWYDAGRYRRKLIGREIEAVQIDGVWYWVVFADVPPPRLVVTTAAGIERKTWQVQGRVDFVTGVTRTSGRYRADKRQMSTRDLRRHGLCNLPTP